jgi:hypothetical protein
LRLEAFVEIPKIDGTRVGTGHALCMDGRKTKAPGVGEIRVAARILHGLSHLVKESRTPDRRPASRTKQREEYPTCGEEDGDDLGGNS